MAYSKEQEESTHYLKSLVRDLLETIVETSVCEGESAGLSSLVLLED